MVLTALALGVILAFGAGPVMAQDVKIQTTRPGPEGTEKVDAARLPHERTRPTDQDYYPGGAGVAHEPAFIESLSGEYQAANSSGRVGIAGWTSPNSPLGPEVGGHREVTGWFGLGFSVTWGGPPRATTRRPAP